MDVAEVVELKRIRVLRVGKLTVLQEAEWVPVLFSISRVQSVDVESVYLHWVLSVIEEMVLSQIIGENTSLTLKRFGFGVFASLFDFLDFFPDFVNHFLRN